MPCLYAMLMFTPCQLTEMMLGSVLLYEIVLNMANSFTIWFQSFHFYMSFHDWSGGDILAYQLASSVWMSARCTAVALRVWWGYMLLMQLVVDAWCSRLSPWRVRQILNRSSFLTLKKMIARRTGVAFVAAGKGWLFKVLETGKWIGAQPFRLKHAHAFFFMKCDIHTYS